MREESYKVYIVLPEKSGFSGKLEERTAAEQELFFHLQMHSIYRGKNSIQAYLDDWNLKQGTDFKIFHSSQIKMAGC